MVHAGGPYLFESTSAAEGSALPARLFSLEGIASVVIADNVVTVAKTADVPWERLTSSVAGSIRAQLGSGVPAVNEARYEASRRSLPDGEMAAAIQQVLDRELNPGVAGHGGKIEVDRFENGVVYLRMTGGCQGCSSAQVTLKQGAEVAVRRAFAQVTDVIDVTDHSAGTSPYFT
jgi:Fe-S cluster biogenesis protein NfuA